MEVHFRHWIKNVIVSLFFSQLKVYISKIWDKQTLTSELHDIFIYKIQIL